MGISVFVNRSHFLQQQRVTTVGFRLDCVTLHGEEPDFTLASYRALLRPFPYLDVIAGRMTFALVF